MADVSWKSVKSRTPPVRYVVYYSKGFLKLQAGNVSHLRKKIPLSSSILGVSPKYDKEIFRGANRAPWLPCFLPIFPLFAKEFVVDGLDRQLGIRLVQQDRNLDLTGGNHMNVDVCIVQCTKHLGSHAGVVHHTGANNGNFHHALIHVDVIEGQALLVLLEQRHRLVHVAAAHGKADVLGPLPANGLDDDVHVDVFLSQQREHL